MKQNSMNRRIHDNDVMEPTSMSVIMETIIKATKFTIHHLLNFIHIDVIVRTNTSLLPIWL